MESLGSGLVCVLWLDRAKKFLLYYYPTMFKKSSARRYYYKKSNNDYKELDNSYFSYFRECFYHLQLTTYTSRAATPD